jgi:hypothetical protein
MTREDWLNRFVDHARPVFVEIGHALPANIRVAIGFCSTGRKSKRIGECWSSEASADQHFEIFIHPGLQSDTSRIADILTHELCHTAAPGDGHGKLFGRVARGVGLDGKLTATVAGANWHAWADPILAHLGPLPGADLQGAAMGRKKQATRLIKAECNECGLIFRITAKYAGLNLQCPDHDCQGQLTLG